MQPIDTETKRKLIEKTQASGGKKILLIDDKKDCALSAALKREGYDVIHCDSVRRAWSFVYPKRPQLIIVHLYNAKRTDLADIQECHVLAEGVPIILATSAQVNETLVKDLQHRAAAILALPLVPGTIRKVLNNLEVSTMGDNHRPLDGTH